MIYDCNGVIWATPRRIGFRAEVQTTSHEPADSVTLPTPAPKIPEWVSEERHAEPYSAPTKPREI